MGICQIKALEKHMNGPIKNDPKSCNVIGEESYEGQVQIFLGPKGRTHGTIRGTCFMKSSSSRKFQSLDQNHVDVGGAPRQKQIKGGSL